MDIKKGLLFSLGFIVALAILLAIMGSASADDSPQAVSKDKTVTVTGTGSVYATPDIAKFSTGVVTQSASSSDAMQNNAQLMDKVVKAIKATGIPDKDVRTGQVSLEPQYSTNAQGVQDTSKIIGYKATNTVTVTIRDLSKVGSTIDAATGAGANQVNGVSFELSDELAASTYKQALKKAVADGADKAKTIADAAGTSALTLKSLSESSTYYPQPVYMDFAAAGAKAAPMAVSTPVSPGEQKVQATVTMVYTFT